MKATLVASVLLTVLAMAVVAAAQKDHTASLSFQVVKDDDGMPVRKAAMSKSRVANLVNQYGVNFVLTNEAEQRLRNAGADSDSRFGPRLSDVRRQVFLPGASLVNSITKGICITGIPTLVTRSGTTRN